MHGRGSIGILASPQKTYPRPQLSCHHVLVFHLATQLADEREVVGRASMAFLLKDGGEQ